jgi:hypothetical protein
MIAHAAENAAMAAGCDIAAGPRIHFHDFARREDLLFLQHDHTGAVAALLVGPNARGDVFNGIGEVLRSVVADFAVGTLRGIAANRHGRIHQQVEPVSRLLNLWASLREDRAVIFPAGENASRRVGEPRQCRARRRLADVERLVGEKVLAADFRRNIAFTPVGPARGRKALGVTAGRQHAVKVDVCERRNKIADAGGADRQAVDLFEAARPVRIKALACLVGGSTRRGAFFLPGLAVRLPRHVWQRIEAVLGLELDLEHGLVVRAGPLFAEDTFGVEISVRRSVKLDGIGFKRMSGEAFDIHFGGSGQTLRPQDVEALLAAIRVVARRQAVFASRLVGGDERRRILDRSRRAGEMGDLHFTFG